MTKMKVLLVNDVEHLGKAGEIKDVAGGFGRNYLIPKGFAVLATRGQIRQAEERLAATNRRAASARKDAEALAARVNGVTLRFVVRVGEQNRLYGSVTSADIAEKLQQQTGVEIDRRKISLEEPIKQVGAHQVSVRLAAGVEPVLTVSVEGEGGSPALVTVPAPPAETPELPATFEDDDEVKG